MIEKGKQVAIEYSVFLQDKTPVDSNVGRDPLVFSCGSKQILPALEDSLCGLEVGDTEQITLQPEQAYGQVNPSAFKEIDLEAIPENFRFEGALLLISDESCGEKLIRVDQLKGSKAVLDFNHPLAGKVLTFDVRVLDIS